jgi:hypothetical protein
MSRIRMIAVGAALVMFVYFGATAADTHVGVITAAVQATLEAEMAPEWIGEWFIGVGGSDVAALPALVGIMLLLFGGLPLAVLSLVLKPEIRVPYAVLMFQTVSTLLSGFLLLVLGAPFLEAAERGSVQAVDWFLPTYLLWQTLAGGAAIPIWRRLLRSASDDRAGALRLARASRT